MIQKSIDIKCPQCGKLAHFEEPFEFLSSRENVQLDNGDVYHQWGGWIVVERFPSLISWRPPSSSRQYLRGGGKSAINGGYPLLTNGLIQCSHCYKDQKHRLHWPADAYWSWEIRGQWLWAWDRSHAQLILDFVKKVNRPARRSYLLRYIPSVFLSARNREAVVSKISKSIEAAASEDCSD